MKPIAVIAGAFLALVPVTLTASTLQMRINEGEASFSDQGPGDNSPFEGILAIDGFAHGGYEFVRASATRQEGSPFDQLFADVELTKLSGPAASIIVDVTAGFTNPGAGFLPAVFSSTANDALGSDWTVRSYIGSAAYDLGILALEDTGSVTALRSVIMLDTTDYWITHRFFHTGEAGTATGATADFADFAVIPVPAAGLLLIGGLGALALARRRKTV